MEININRQNVQGISISPIQLIFSKGVKHE